MIERAMPRERDLLNRRAHSRYRFREHLRVAMGGMELRGRSCDISAGGISIDVWFPPSSMVPRSMSVRMDGLPPLEVTIAWRTGDRSGGPFTPAARRSAELAALMKRLAAEGVEV